MKNVNITSLLGSAPPYTSEYRILCTKLQWPEGQPPFSAGVLSVPEIPATPDKYVEADFVEEDWTDVSNLVEGFSINSTLENPIDVLSLTLKTDVTNQTHYRAFKPMRCILVQCRYSSTTVVVDWITIKWFLSTGATNSVSSEAKQYTVNALDILMLSNINILENINLSPDLLAHGSFSTPKQLAVVGITETEYEYGISSGPAGVVATGGEDLAYLDVAVTEEVVGQQITCVNSTGTKLSATILGVDEYDPTLIYLDGNVALTDDHYYIGWIEPNWCDKPPSYVWFTDVPNQSTKLPCNIAGEYINTVYGEGIVRVSRIYAEAPSELTDGKYDFSFGLGYSSGVPPTLAGVFYRFSHTAILDRDGVPTISDQIVSEVVQVNAGSIQVSDTIPNLTGYITVIINDNTLRQYAVEYTDGDIIYLKTTGVVCQAGDMVTVYNANYLPDVLKRLMLYSGFQETDNTVPFYIDANEAPEVNGEAVNITVPPIVIPLSTEDTPLAAWQDLVSRGFVPPFFSVRSTSGGNIKLWNIKVDTNNALEVPMAMTLDVDATDLNVFSRILVEGMRRTVENYMDLEPLIHAGELPEVEYVTNTVEIDSVTYTLANCSETVNPPVNPNNYYYDINNLATRKVQKTVDANTLRPWCWHSLHPLTDAGVDDANALVNSWIGKVVAEVIFSSPKTIGSLQVLAHNPYWETSTDYVGADIAKDYLVGTKTAIANAEPQILSFEYFDEALYTWCPLASNVVCKVEFPFEVELGTTDFDRQLPVTTSKIRVVCTYPFVARCDATGFFHNLLGVYISRLAINSPDTIQGEAELGQVLPFASSDWYNLNAEFRRRTKVIQNVQWAGTIEEVNDLAAAYLVMAAKNLVPKTIRVFRPDVEVGDTVAFTMPGGELQYFLVTSVTLDGSHISTIAITDYSELFFTPTEEVPS
jgi:hypothetical protein